MAALHRGLTALLCALALVFGPARGAAHVPSPALIVICAAHGGTGAVELPGEPDSVRDCPFSFAHAIAPPAPGPALRLPAKAPSARSTAFGFEPRLVRLAAPPARGPPLQPGQS